MTQIITTKYKDLDTAQMYNRKTSRVIRAGVYSGYFVEAQGSALLSIGHGSDTTSVLLTQEGVRIEEPNPVSNVLKVSAADGNYERRDLVVAEYTFSTASDTQQTYKILRGACATTLTGEGVPPTPASNQIPLAVIRVRPQRSTGGSAGAIIDQSDVFNSIPASCVIAPELMGSLKPIIDPVTANKIYVHPGRYPNLDGSTFVEFNGGYSPEWTYTGTSATKYLLYGISDDQSIGVMETTDAVGDIQDLASDSMPLCIVKAYWNGTVGILSDLIDVRFPFTRRMTPQFEADTYQDLLGNSIFDKVYAETFSDDSFIDLDSVDEDNGVEVKVERGDTSLSFIWLAAGSPTDDVTVSTKNLIIDGVFTSTIKHIMLLASCSHEGIKFDYSTVSSTSGFRNSAGYSFNDIISILGDGASRLFIKFIVPKTLFDGATTVKIYNYGLYYGLNSDTVNNQVLPNMPIGSINLLVDNLIPNGNFYYWTADDASAKTPDLTSQDTISYKITSSSPYAADGWQFTSMGSLLPKNGTVQRVIVSKDVNLSTVENTMDTGIQVGFNANLGSNLYLTYIIPNAQDLVGQRITYAFDYITNNPDGLGIQLVYYTRNQTDQTLSAVSGGTIQAGALELQGTLTVTSPINITDSVVAIGFQIIFAGTGSDTLSTIFKARAAVGNFKTLDYTPARDPWTRIGRVYERGSVLTTGQFKAGNMIACANNFRSPKDLELGDLVVSQIASSTSNRSTNVSSVSFEKNRFGHRVQGIAASAGFAALDLDWEARIKYKV